MANEQLPCSDTEGGKMAKLGMPGLYACKLIRICGMQESGHADHKNVYFSSKSLRYCHSNTNHSKSS